MARISFFFPAFLPSLFPWLQPCHLLFLFLFSSSSFQPFLPLLHFSTTSSSSSLFPPCVFVSQEREYVLRSVLSVREREIIKVGVAGGWVQRRHSEGGALIAWPGRGMRARPRQEHKGNTRQTQGKGNQRDEEAGTDVTVNLNYIRVLAQQMPPRRYLVKLEMHLTIIYLHEQTFLFLFPPLHENKSTSL